MSQCISHASQRYKEKAPKAIVPEAFNTNLTHSESVQNISDTVIQNTVFSGAVCK